ncbi:hypothetical protein, partial [Pseudomonas pseudonitroreducens]|uniref:hypothetical protein n=1 Tax=Pseudomonas pseudonitroreducens TaxID=2892326 RepID=UPI001F3F787E
MNWVQRISGVLAVLIIIGLVVAGAEAMQSIARTQGYATAQAEGKAVLELQQRKYAEAEARRAQQAEAD